MIEKPAILVTSIGRTGTEFFAKLFADIIPNCTSLHEPDIIKFPGVKNRFAHYNQQILRAGVWRMVVLKAFGKWTLAKLSDSKFLGNLSLSEATQKLHTQRKGFISKMPGSLYVESNLGYYGLLDVIPNVFKDYRTIYIVRDGRDWVRSTLNWGEVYGKVGIRKLFAHKWPTAKNVKDDEYATQWDDFSRFEQLCWAWSRLNEYAINTISENPNARIYKFESIFIDENRYENLDELVSFSASLPGVDSGSLGSTSGWLEQKIHQSSNQFPDWEQWTKDQKHIFEEICGPQMERLGYVD
jgi:hypothetical protein